jgi:hypothetical protein
MSGYGMTAIGAKPTFAVVAMCAECQNRSLRAPLGRWARVATPDCRVSACFQGKDKDLAGIYTIWISDPVSVRFVNDRVSRAHAVGDTADAPQAVATRYDRGRNLGLDHGGR